LISILLAVGLTGCAGKGAEKPDGGETGAPHGGLLEEVVSSISGSGDERGQDRQASVERSVERIDREDTEEVTVDAPSLIYTRRYYDYRVRNGKDPFHPLLSEGQQLEGLSLNALMLTGIMWDDSVGMVVMEDSKGRGYPLHVGDKLAGARLVAIREDAAVFRVVEFGMVHNVVKELFLEEERPI